MVHSLFLGGKISFASVFFLLFYFFHVCTRTEETLNGFDDEEAGWYLKEKNCVILLCSKQQVI
jgi:hypothetical protein